MMSWRESTLGDVCELYQPKTISSADLVDGGEYPVYGANGVIGRFDKFNHAEPQLLITCRGATCGSVNISQSNSWINGNAMVVRPKDASVELDYLKHLFKGGLDLSAVITGAAQPQITRQSLAPLKIRFPDPKEQRRIAAILDQADALRAKRREALAQLDSLTQAIFVEMFGDPAKNPFHWPLMTLGEMATKFSDGPFGSNLKSEHYVDIGIRVIRLQNIGVNEFVEKDKAYISKRHFETIKKHECRPGDVLVGTMGAPNLRACLLPEKIGIAVNKADCVQIRVAPQIANSIFLCGLLNNPSTLLLAQNLMHGQTRVRISMGGLRGLEVPVPPLPLQQTFAKRIQSVETLKVNHCAALEELNRLFASLQHRAFQGEL